MLEQVISLKELLQRLENIRRKKCKNELIMFKCTEHETTFYLQPLKGRCSHQKIRKWVTSCIASAHVTHCIEHLGNLSCTCNLTRCKTMPVLLHWSTHDPQPCFDPEIRLKPLPLHFYAPSNPTSTLFLNPLQA